MNDSNQITTLLQRWQDGDSEAQEALFQIVYRDLRRIAENRLRNEFRNHTLMATELVHEIYPQLARQRASWQNRSHFFALTSECMRRYLVDYARTRQRQKRGGDAFKISLSDLRPSEICRIETDDEVLAVDRSLSKLNKLDKTAATVIKYRYFGGMSREEIGEILQVSPATVDRTYRFAKAWLKRELAFEFSPYLLSEAQVTDKEGFINQLKSGSGNQLALQWRRILTTDTLAGIDSINGRETLTGLLPKVISAINKSLLGNLFQPGSDSLSSEETVMMADEQIKYNRRLIDEAFSGRLLRLT